MVLMVKNTPRLRVSDADSPVEAKEEKNNSTPFEKSSREGHDCIWYFQASPKSKKKKRRADRC